MILSLAQLGLTDPRCPAESAALPVTAIRIEGLESTRPHIVRRYLQHHVDGPFKCQWWREEKAALESLDIFASVDLVVTPSAKGRRLTYRFAELPQFLAFPAIKATDQLGWAGGAGISVLNLAGEDIRLDFYIRTTLSPDPFSATEYMLYTHSPQMGDLPLEWELTVAHTDSNNPLVEFAERSFMADVVLRYPLGWGELEGLLVGSIFTVAHDPNQTLFAPGDGNTVPLFLSDTDRDWVPRLGIGLVYDTRETLYNPHFGTYAEVSVAMYGGALGGATEYWEWLADLRAYLPIWGPDVLLISSLGRYRPGRFGAYDLLHIGGANTVRGHPTLPQYYGRHEVLNTLEYRREFFERAPFSVLGSNLYLGFQWVLGMDAAFQWRDDEHPPAFLSSLYTGPHILLPGLDRLRLEFALTQVHDAPAHWTYGVSLGLFEKAHMQRFRVR